MPELISQTELAKRHGVGKSAVSNWKKAGLLVFAEGDDGRSLVDAARTAARLNARRDPTRGRPSTSEPAPELPIEADPADGSASQQRHLAQVRRDNAEEDLITKRMRNAESARELVPAIEAESRLGTIGRMARERVQSEMRGRAERLAAEREPRRIMVLIDEAIDKAFHALADAVLSGAAEIDDTDGEEVIQAEAA